jgi:hypothetical protein
MAGQEQRSKRQSDGSPSDKPPEPTVYFLDENFGNKIAPPILQRAGMRVETFSAHFASGTHDDAWIPQVVSRGWVILTTDKNFRYKPNEREELERSGARVFVFTGAQMRGAEAAAVIAGSIGGMKKVLDATDPPFVATITRGGEVTVRWPKQKRPG